MYLGECEKCQKRADMGVVEHVLCIECWREFVYGTLPRIDCNRTPEYQMFAKLGDKGYIDLAGKVLEDWANGLQ